MCLKWFHGQLQLQALLYIFIRYGTDILNLFLVLVTEEEVAQGDNRADIVYYVAVVANIRIKYTCHSSSKLKYVVVVVIGPKALSCKASALQQGYNHIDEIP